MLLIRPLLNTNAERRHKAHTVVFAIFIVANCGGLLTPPLGDPPLFLGMLHGVPFLWTLNLFPPMWLFVNGMLLLTYWALDRRIIAHERPEDVEVDRTETVPLRLVGASNLLWFAVIILAVALAPPSIDAEAITHGEAGIGDVIPPWREIIMVGAAIASLKLGDREIRYRDNAFELGPPIQEVAALFIGIFLTMIPALAVLRAAAPPSLPLNEITLFIFTGGLSSVLDNAPTYLTFFEMASQLPGEPPRVATSPPSCIWSPCPSAPSSAGRSPTSATARTSWSSPSQSPAVSRCPASAATCCARSCTSCRSSWRWCCCSSRSRCGRRGSACC